MVSPFKSLNRSDLLEDSGWAGGREKYKCSSPNGCRYILQIRRGTVKRSYEHRGYKTVGHGIYELENDVKLVYEIMEKKLQER